jgi:hypothetical protein
VTFEPGSPLAQVDRYAFADAFQHRLKLSAKDASLGVRNSLSSLLNPIPGCPELKARLFSDAVRCTQFLFDHRLTQSTRVGQSGVL